MKTVVAFTGNKVQIICGEGSARKISVTKVINVDFDINCVMNGVITDTDVFCAGIRQVFAANSLPKAGIILSLDGNNIRSKKIDIPKVNEKKIQEIVTREFKEVEAFENPIFGFVSLSASKDQESIIAIGVETDFVQALTTAFLSVGIKVSAITSSRCAMIKFLSYLDFVKNANCIIQTINGEALTTVLLEQGRFVSFSNIRIFSDHGTPSFGTEVARSVSQLLQFQQSERSQNPATDLFMAGFADPDFALSKEQAEALSLKVNSFSGSAGLSLSEPMNGTIFLHAGALSLSRTEGNVLADYSQKKKITDKRDKFLIKLFPILAIVAIFSLVGSSMVISNMTKENHIRALRDYIESPENIQAEQDYNLKLEESAKLNAKITATADCKAAIESYPLATSALNAVIAASGSGIVDVNIQSYSAVSGGLSFTALGTNAEKINEFVKALTDTGVFYGLTYSGYELTAAQGGTYTVNISCTLSQNAGR